MQWLEDASQINAHNPNNIRRDAGRWFNNETWKRFNEKTD